MLLTRLLRRKKTDGSEPERTRWVMFLVIAILGSTVIIKLVNSTLAPSRSLLAYAPGLMEFSTLDQLVGNSSLPITAPEETFGAELYVVGVYPEVNNVFPTGTVSLVYTKNGWRTLEVDYLPNRTAQDQLATLAIYPQEEIILDGTTSATLITRDDSPRCIDYDDGLPNKCEITNQLLFEYEGLLISLSSDGDHATIGELIEIAKSLADR